MNINYQQVIACLESYRSIGNGDIDTALIKSEATSAECTIVVDHDLKLIMPTAKGSQELRDWFIDTQFYLKVIGYYDDRPMKLHSGFDKAALSVEGVFITQLVETMFEYKDYLTLYTGHSLGAATITRIAHLSAQIIDAYFPARQSGIVLFGSPHPGNVEFKRIMNRWYHIFNFQNENDKVPQLLSNIAGYEPVGYVIKLEDVSDDTKKADNCAACFADHDLYNDYYLPIVDKMKKEGGLHGMVN